MPSHHPKQNHLLACMPDDQYERLLPALELIRMPLGWSISGDASASRDIYFPVTSTVSFLAPGAEAASIEIAVVGRDGVIGYPTRAYDEVPSWTAVVKTFGYGYRLPAALASADAARKTVLSDIAERYSQAVAAQMTKTALCNQLHTLEQRFGRWLLLSLDLLAANEIVMADPLVCLTLGMSREGLTESTRLLRKDSVIRHRRGSIELLDRPGLEARLCECYVSIKKDMARLMLDIPDADPRQVRTSTS